MKKKRTPVFLSVYVDKDKKQTFQSGYVDFIPGKDKEGNDATELKFIPNEMALDKYGDPYVKPMNRLARRIKAKQLRLHEKKYGKKKQLKETADRPFTLDAKVVNP